MMHIVFNTADADVLRSAMELDESFSGEILEIRDDYAVGPVNGLDTREGREARKEWWKQVLAGGDYDGLVEKGVVNDEAAVSQIREKLQASPEEQAWIWAAQNSHDVCGYYWLMSQLKDFQGQVYILYLNNLPFINEKGQLFYPVNLHQIPPREFLKARKLARPVTLSEFEVDPDEWSKLAQEARGVRLLEGGKKLVQADYDYFDNDLRSYISADWQKASRVIHQFLNKNKVKTGDAYLLWRLKNLLGPEDYDVQGEVKNMKDFEIKKKSETREFSE